MNSNVQLPSNLNPVSRVLNFYSLVECKALESFDSNGLVLLASSISDGQITNTLTNRDLGM